jgi:hypothetical protein
MIGQSGLLPIMDIPKFSLLLVFAGAPVPFPLGDESVPEDHAMFLTINDPEHGHSGSELRRLLFSSHKGVARATS